MRFAIVLGALWSAVGCSTACEDLRHRLSRAEPGDVVEVGACSALGGLTVPPGVFLEGVGSSTAAVEALPGKNEVLILETRDALVTGLRNLRILGRGVAVRTVGDGTARLEDVAIEVETGWGIVAESRLELAGVRIVGPVTSENATDPRWVIEESSTTGWIGIDLAAEGSFEDVEVVGMAQAGVVVRGVSLTARRLVVRDTLSFGLLAEDADLELVQSAVERVFQGSRGDPAVAIGLTDTTLDATTLRLQGNERYGLLAQGGVTRLHGLEARDNLDAAVWVGGARELTIDELSEVSGGRFAGVVAFECDRVLLRDTSVTNIASQRRNVGSGSLLGAIELGDGVQLMGTLPDARLENVELTDNARAGLMLDLTASTVSFDGVRVEGPPTALGAVAGRGGDALSMLVEPEVGWDVGVVRGPNASVNDAEFRGEVAVVRLASPTGT
jgi:hypothetical protein